MILFRQRVGTWRSQVAHSAGGRVVAGSNPAVPTLLAGARVPPMDIRKVWILLDTIYLLLGIIGFMVVIAAFFFGGYVILDFLFSRLGGDR